MTPSNPSPVRSRLAGTLRGRRNVTIAVFVAAAVLMWLLAGINHHSGGSRPGATVVPLLSEPSASASTSTAASTPPSTGVAPGPSASSASDDGTGDDSTATVGAGGFAQATITSGPTDPAVAAVNFLIRYLAVEGRSPQEWRANAKTDDNKQPLVTPELSVQIDQADPPHVPGVIDPGSAHVYHTGDFQMQVWLNLAADRNHLNRVVDTLVVWLDGSSHRWLVSQLDEQKPGATR